MMQIPAEMIESTGRVVQLKPGTFWVKEPFDLPPDTEVRGVPKFSTRLLHDPEDGPFTLFQGGSSSLVTGIRFEGCRTVSGDGA